MFIFQLMTSPIKEYTTARISDLIAKASAFSSLDHNVSKGTLRELLVNGFLKSYLTNDFGIGSGIILNQKEEQSKQIDVLIYDKRILPPFVIESNLGVYPAESIVATIEVKSWISKSIVQEESKKNYDLLTRIYNPKSSIYGDYNFLRPITAIIGFYDQFNFNYENNKENRSIIKRWVVDDNLSYFGICSIGHFSWLNVIEKGGVVHLRSDKYQQTKAFFSILLDNIRTPAHKRYFSVIGRHNDWFSLYLRDQNLSKFFK